MLPHFYHERQRKRKKRLMLTGICFFAVLSTVCLGVFFYQPTKTTGVSKPANEPILEANASLELTTLYECGHSKTRLLPLPDNLIGKSQEEAAQLYPKWRILNFNESFLVAEEKEGTECDDHFHLFLKDNTIIVTNSKDKTHIITEQTINLNLLTEEDQQILKAGIFINSEYELLEILESFQ